MMNVNLILFKTNGTKLSFSLSNAVTLIGRQRDCNVCIPSRDISRKHCEFYVHRNQLMIRDLASLNGTFLNKKRIERQARVHEGDILRIGSVVLGIQINGSPIDTESMRPPDRPIKKLLDTKLIKKKANEAFDSMMVGLSEDFDMNQTSNKGVEVGALSS